MDPAVLCEIKKKWVVSETELLFAFTQIRHGRATVCTVLVIHRLRDGGDSTGCRSVGWVTAASLHARFKTSLPPAGSGGGRSRDGGVAERVGWCRSGTKLNVQEEEEDLLVRRAESLTALKTCDSSTADLTSFYWCRFKVMFHRRNHLKVEN